MLSAEGSHGEPKYEVYHSAVLDADADTVWEVMRDILQVVEIAFGNAVENVQWKKGAHWRRFPRGTASRCGLTAMTYTRRWSGDLSTNDR